jgi:hypothetical protein
LTVRPPTITADRWFSQLSRGPEATTTESEYRIQELNTDQRSRSSRTNQTERKSRVTVIEISSEFNDKI